VEPASTKAVWNPKQTNRLPEPTTVSVSKQQEQVKLTWQADPKAKQFIVQKRQCNKDGWGTWQDAITDAKGNEWLDQAPSTPVAYRVRAIGDDGAISDWSKTIYLR